VNIPSKFETNLCSSIPLRAPAAASNAAIAQAAYGAYVTKDRAALEALLADEFHFTSPLDNRLNRDRHIVEVEVYFGWSLPHKAPRGSFVDAA